MVSGGDRRRVARLRRPVTLRRTTTAWPTRRPKPVARSVVDPTIESVAVLGMIVLIRIVLSFSLEVEIEGAWPWNRWKTLRRGDGREGEPAD